MKWAEIFWTLEKHGHVFIMLELFQSLIIELTHIADHFMVVAFSEHMNIWSLGQVLCMECNIRNSRLSTPCIVKANFDMNGYKNRPLLECC